MFVAEGAKKKLYGKTTEFIFRKLCKGASCWKPNGLE